MDPEGVERIQDTLVDLDAKFRKVKQLVDELMESDQAKHNTLDDLQGLMSNIQSTIVTKVGRFVECFKLMLNFRICSTGCLIKRSTRTNSMTL